MVDHARALGDRGRERRVSGIAAHHRDAVERGRRRASHEAHTVAARAQQARKMRADLAGAEDDVEFGREHGRSLA